MSSTFASYINDFFEKLDIIGMEAKLKIQNNTRNKTYIGGMLCMLIYALLLIGALYFGQELYFKHVPTTITSNILNTAEDSINIGRNGFFFLF